jgi:hypothetical protein
MIEPSLSPFAPSSVPTDVIEHALAHAEQPTRPCGICASGSTIRPEDFDVAVDARLYNARQLVASMSQHLSRQRYPQVSLGTLHQLLREMALLRLTRSRYSGAEISDAT